MTRWKSTRPWPRRCLRPSVSLIRSIETLATRTQKRTILLCCRYVHRFFWSACEHLYIHSFGINFLEDGVPNDYLTWRRRRFKSNMFPHQIGYKQLHLTFNISNTTTNQLSTPNNMSESSIPACTGCKRLTEEQVMAIIIGLSITCGVLISVFFVYLGYAMRHKKRADHAEQQLYALYTKSSANPSDSHDRPNPAGSSPITTQTTAPTTAAETAPETAPATAPRRPARPTTIETVAESVSEVSES